VQDGTSLQFGLNASGFLIHTSERVIWKGVGWTWASDSHHITLAVSIVSENMPLFPKAHSIALLLVAFPLVLRKKGLKCYFGLSEANRL
jgi:hypothetical protein